MKGGQVSIISYCYGLDGLRLEPRWGCALGFTDQFSPARGPTQPVVQSAPARDMWAPRVG